MRSLLLAGLHIGCLRNDLKYLDDPEGTMGEAESINTVVRQGLADDMPEATKY